jgi:nudix-type nucleoside diphosphatase (YffH/AdpP family)
MHEITKVDTIHEGWAKYLVATVRLPDGRLMRREIEHHGAAAAVLPYDPGRKTAILVQQFRAPAMLAANQPFVLEAIAGIVEEDDPQCTAQREALEEAGLQLGELEAVATVWSMPGISTERMSLFVAPYRADNRVAAGGGLADEHEDITVVELGLSALARMVDAGEIFDMKTLALIQTLRLRRPELFVP